MAVNGNEIAKLFVEPDCHSLGIGAKLVDSAEKIIVEAGYKELIVGVMASSAIGFYEKMGMSQFDEKIIENGAFAGCKIPIMKKNLTSEQFLTDR